MNIIIIKSDNNKISYYKTRVQIYEIFTEKRKK